jgi:RNA polymerase sigma factor (sigma-70 family)
MRNTVPEKNTARFLSLVAPRETSERDVALALCKGESWATDETWRRYAPMVLTLNKRCLGSSAEAEDVTQEVFYRVFRKAHTLRDPDCLRSFVYSFAVRVLKSELRRRKVRAWISFGPTEELEDLPGQTPDLVARDLLQRFHTLLDRLSPSDRLAFILRRVEAMTVAEIATHMDISSSSVKRYLIRATHKLQRWVEADPSLAQLLESGHLVEDQVAPLAVQHSFSDREVLP